MMISRIAQTALILSGMGVMLALPAQAQQVVMTPEGTAFLMVPVEVPAFIGSGKVTPLPEPRDPNDPMIAPTLPVIIGDGKVTPLPEPRDPNDPMIAPTLPVIIGDGKVTPLPEPRESLLIVPGSDRTSPGSPFAPPMIVEDPGSVRVGGDNAVLYRDAKLIDNPGKPLHRLTEAEERDGLFTTSAPIARSSSAVQIIPNQNLKIINGQSNGNTSPLSTSRIFPFPLR